MGAKLVLIAAAVAGSSVTAVRDAYPHLSPDGTTLLFHSNRTGKQAIWAAEGNGANPRLLFDGRKIGTDPGTPVWSPDGKSIAFAMRPAGATDENESEIYVMRADGTRVRRLTDAAGDDSHPHWASDGARIFFNSARATPDLKADWSRQWHEIYSMRADGTDVRRHTECKSVCTYPVPSPDGRSVAHRRIVDGPGLNWALDPGLRNSEVFVTALDGSSSVNVSNNPAFDGWPMWSPNGRWLIFSSNRDKRPRVGQIYAVRPDGSRLTALTTGVVSRVQPSFAGAKHLFAYENLETSEFEIGHIASFEISLPD